MIITQKELPPRRDYDFYPTPEWVVNRALELVQDQYSEYDPDYPAQILDPGSGSGVWGTLARKRWPYSEVTGVEIRDIPHPPTYKRIFTDDFLNWNPTLWPRYNLVVGNPPYKHAEQFIRKGLDHLLPRGHLGFLLRLAFLEGQARRDGLFKDFPPKIVAICSKRPSFTEDQKTNATAFMLALWEKGYTGPTIVQWL